jgi:hypothetical protein
LTQTIDKNESEARSGKCHIGKSPRTLASLAPISALQPRLGLIIPSFVNGIAINSDEHGKDVDRTIFADVFAYSDGRWQAINAQENRVETMLRPNRKTPH